MEKEQFTSQLLPEKERIPSLLTERYDIRMKIIERFINIVCASYHPLAIANSLWALGMMGVSLGTIPSDSLDSSSSSSSNSILRGGVSTDLSLIKQKVLQTIQRIIPECTTAWTLTTIIR